jgi:MFS family permease
MDHSDTSHVSKFTFKRSVLPWAVWGLACLFYFYEFLLQVSPGVMSKELMHDFGITSHMLGLLSGIYFYSYASMQLPAGLLMDYFGPKRLLALACTTCALSTISFSMTESFLMASFARLAIGFGSAFAMVGTMKLASNWFNTERFALLTGIMVTIGMLGAIGGEAPLALLIETFGWRQSMFIMGIAGLLLATLVLLVVSDHPSVHSAHTKHRKAPEPIIKSFLCVIHNKQLWLVAIYGGLMYMATPVLCGLWGVPFLMMKLGVDKITAALLVTWILIGWAVASPLWGYISNRIGQRKIPMYIGTVGTLFCLCPLLYAPLHHIFWTQCLLVGFGVFSAGFLPSFATARELCTESTVAAGLGFMNMMNMVGIAICQPAIGFLLDRLWDGTTAHGVRVYPITAYQCALSLLPLGLLVAFFTLPFVKETHCKNIHTQDHPGPHHV